MGKSRRDVGETLGLSTGRVQQLNDDPPAELVAEVDRFIRDAMQIAAVLETRPSSRDEVPSRHGLGSDRVDEVVMDMLALGMLVETPEGLKVTDIGQIVSAAGSKRSLSSRTARKAHSGDGQAANAHHDRLPAVGPGVGAVALIYEQHWVLASLVFVLGTTMSLIAWDVRRAGGLAAWAGELILAAGDWDEFVDQRKARRDARRTQHLRERGKRRQIRQSRRRVSQ